MSYIKISRNTSYLFNNKYVQIQIQYKFVRPSAIKTRKQTFFKSETHLKLNIVLLVLWLCFYVIQKYNFN